MIARPSALGLLLAAAAVLPATAAPAGTEPADPALATLAPYEADESIRAMATEIERRWHDPARKAEAVVQRIFWQADGGLGFRYRSHPTLTASEAFQHREGNCLTLVNLFVALARNAGLRVFFVEVEDFETFYRYDQTVVRSTHVVGGVIIDGTMRTIDFLPDRDKRYRKLRIISDERATAHYYNGVAAEAMLDDDLERAGALFERALVADPKHVPTWNNYAILTRRLGRLDQGITRLEWALELDPHFLPAMENLSTYYALAGKPAKADEMRRRALDEKTRNPYYLSHQAMLELQRGELGQAEAMLRRARRLDRSVPEVHLLLGRVELARGKAERAETHFERARKAGADLSDTYQQRLDSKIRALVVAQVH